MRYPSRSWLRFSLRTSLLAFLFASLVAGWISSEMREYETEQQIIAEIHDTKPYRAEAYVDAEGGLLPVVY